MKVHLLTKTDHWCDAAVMESRTVFGDQLRVSRGEFGDDQPEYGDEDVILSFRSPWIVPAHALAHAKIAINFHPGTRDYPGTGCYNFALYEGAKRYGAIAHEMFPKVDAGPIIEERTFPVTERDTVATLKARTMIVMLAMFQDICGKIWNGESLPIRDYGWSRKPFTRREFEQLRVVTPDMDEREVARRTRAVTYPGFPGVVEVSA